MKFFVLASALFVIAKAGVIPSVAVPAVTRITAPAFLTAIPLARHSSQYHSQDSIGQYSYGYANDLSAKNEIKSADGQTVGSYSYIDGNGQIQNVQYR
ncbi:cuticle protein 6-like [Sitophilus oryzae]|nr:cuticle protein 6-like [Sitophilus oryzae]